MFRVPGERTTSRRGAIFDLDGTLLTGISAETRFIRFAIREGFPWMGPTLAWLARIPVKGMRNNKVYYGGACVDAVAELAEACFEREMKAALSPEVREIVQAHQEAGDVTGILTGAPRFVAEPIARFLELDFVEGTRLEVADGRFTGRLAEPRPYGPDKADWAERIALEAGFDLAKASAYGNEAADAWLLARVGEPVAVRPDGHLWRTARERGWRIVPV